MKTRVVSNRWLGVIAVAIALSFVGGFFVSSTFFAAQNSKNIFAVGDSYPYGECVGTCPEHGFTFGMDIVTVTVVHQGQVVFLANYPNLITSGGEDIISNQVACGAISAPPCATYGGVYIALSNDTTPPAATDTTCRGELTSNGLERTLGTYSHTAGANTYEIKASFIYSTNAYSTTVTKVCMFNALSGGELFAESSLSPSATVSAIGDNITIEWTFTH